MSDNKNLTAADLEVQSWAQVVPPALQIDLDLEMRPTTSAKIRYLTALGWKRGDIARKLNIRYQHVRNTQVQVSKKTAAK